MKSWPLIGVVGAQGVYRLRRLRAWFAMDNGRVKTWPKTVLPLAGALGALALAGCSATTEPALLPAVGPDSTAPLAPRTEGVLQVYSARAPGETDVNFQEFFADDDFGGNLFPLEPAHTDYTIYTRAGQVFERVHNARNLDDSQPTSVTLPAGAYNIEAQAKDANPGAFPVVVPVIIQAGRTTRMHLDGD